MKCRCSCSIQLVNFDSEIQPNTLKHLIEKNVLQMKIEATNQTKSRKKCQKSMRFYLQKWSTVAVRSASFSACSRFLFLLIFFLVSFWCAYMCARICHCLSAFSLSCHRRCSNMRRKIHWCCVRQCVRVRVLFSRIVQVQVQVYGCECDGRMYGTAQAEVLPRFYGAQSHTASRLIFHDILMRERCSCACIGRNGWQDEATTTRKVKKQSQRNTDTNSLAAHMKIRRNYYFDRA